MISRQQIGEAVEKGVIWLKSKQNADGSYGDWGLCSTSLAVMALLGSNVPNSDPAVANAISYILRSDPPDSTYFRSLTVMALTANGEKRPDILSRVQLDTEWLVQSQGSNPDNILSFGGWDHFYSPELAVAFNTQHAIMALYSAASWGLTVPQEIWRRAVTWYQRNHDRNNDGSFAYSLGDISRQNNKGVLYGMTAGALSSLKIIKALSSDPGVQSQAQNLLARALDWLSNNYTVELNPGVTDSGQYNYLFSLQKGCIIEPSIGFIGNRDWYADLAGYLVARQKPAGNWASDAGKISSALNLMQVLLGRDPGPWAIEKTTDKIVHTSLALLVLTGGMSAPAACGGGDGNEKAPEGYSGAKEKLDAWFAAENADRQGAKTADTAEQKAGERAEYGAETGSGDGFKDEDSLRSPPEKGGAGERGSGAAVPPGEADKNNGKNENSYGRVNGDRPACRLPAAIWAVIGLILFGLAVFTFQTGKSMNTKVSPPAAYERHPDSLVCEAGKIAPATRELYGKVSGLIEKIRVKPGGGVSAGQVVMNIDPREVEFELSQVEAEIERCLVKINGLSRTPEFELKSGFDGLVTRVHVKPGEEVAANKAIATLLSDRVLDVALEKAGHEYHFLREGLPVDLYLPGGKTLSGVLFSPVQVDRNREGDIKLRVQVLREECDGVFNEEADGLELIGQDNMQAPQKARIVIHTVSGLLETACQVAGGELPVYPEHSGRLVNMYVAEGDTVAAGQPLGRINIYETSMDLKAEKIELNRLRNAQQYLKELLQNYEVVSPVPGQVVALFVKEGDAVRPDTILALLEDPDRYRIDIPITEREAASILPGFPARVTIQEAGDRHFVGEVERVVKGTMDESGRSLRAVVVFDRDPGLEPGMSARVEIFPKL